MNTKIVGYVLCSIFSALPITMVKQYLHSKEKKWLIIALFIYMLLIYGYCHILEEQKISTVYPYLKIMSIVMVIIFGYIVYEEEVDRKKCCGIFLGLSSLYLLS
jgi:multidrug transporter EmrE-like cation transporter